jgi:hypothetical protein
MAFFIFRGVVRNLLPQNISKPFGKILSWLLVYTISTYLFVICKEFIEARSDTKQKELETSKYKKA